MSKYDSGRKLARNKMLLEYRRANPELSLQEIGDAFGISRQRVSQIIMKTDHFSHFSSFQPGKGSSTAIATLPDGEGMTEGGKQ